MSIPVTNDLTTTWSFIQPGLEFILGSHGDQGVTTKMYMNCYTAVYNYCVNKSRTGFGPSKDGPSSYSLAGEEIYNKLTDYLILFIQGLKQRPDETFLQFYVRKWTRFTIGAGYLSNVFDYMNRYWVMKERTDGKRNVYDVNTLCLITWKSEMFENNAAVLINQVLDQIERQRNNEYVDTRVISICIKSLVSLGIDIQDLKKSNLVEYIKHFETKFLESTKNYYCHESQKFLQEHSVVDYMKKCETRLNEEISRCNNYLEDHSKKALVETLNKALIEDHAQEMYDQFLTLLEQNEIENIHRMYKLLSRVPSTLLPLADSFGAYIKDQASKALLALKTTAEENAKQTTPTTSSRRPAGAVDPKTYINKLISIYHEYNSVVSEAFDRDTLFIKALDIACRNFFNKNPIATPSPKVNCKTPELLAKYADGFLRGTSKEADTADMNPDNLMIIFKFINDKDAFEEYYRRLLAKRLINGNSKSEELEERIIKRLQEENSIEYTAKMTKMFSDMKASEDLKKELPSFDSVKDFNPLILAQSMWPFNHSEDYNLNVAEELHKPFEKVVDIYGSKHTGRDLKWLWNHGRAEVKANLSRKGKPPFIFTVSNLQLMILMAFNFESSYTFEELHKKVGGSLNSFEAHLTPFTKYKLIDQSPPGTEHFNLPDTKFTIVEEYKSKKLKVNFISAIKTNESKSEEEQASKEIDETRKNYLSACIVRIMKSRKIVKHNDLINEVLPQTLTRFQAKVIDIKRVIDLLIEREYIQRVDNNSYEYLS
jgi:cullin 1